MMDMANDTTREQYLKIKRNMLGILGSCKCTLGSKVYILRDDRRFVLAVTGRTGSRLEAVVSSLCSTEARFPHEKLTSLTGIPKKVRNRLPQDDRLASTPTSCKA